MQVNLVLSIWVCLPLSPVSQIEGLWFYLWCAGRRQKVKLDGVYSTWRTRRAGVPQGSLLGPLLFNMYVNGHSNFITNTSLRVSWRHHWCHRCLTNGFAVCNKLRSERPIEMVQNESCWLTPLKRKLLPLDLHQTSTKSILMILVFCWYEGYT